MKNILLALFLIFSVRAGASDLALINGKIFTGDPTSNWGEAILIRGDRIEAVGSNEEIKKTAGKSRTIDLQGKLVIPGINDAHVHADEFWNPVTVPSDPQDPLGDPTFPELLELLAKAVSEQPKGTWIRANLSAAILEDPSADRWALDKVAPDHPVWLENFAGHATLLNSAALRALDIREDEENPHGGVYVRRKEDGRLNGYILEYARWNQQQKLGSTVSQEAIRDAIRKFSREALQFGITSVQHFSMVVPADKLYSTLKESSLPIRWRLMWFPLGDEFPQFPRLQAVPNLQVGGVKYVLDGTPVERGAAMENPFADDPGLTGKLNFPREQVLRLMDHVASTGNQILFHCSGDASANMVLSLVQTNGGPGAWASRRLRIEHGDGIFQERAKSFADAGILVVQNPTHLAFPAMMQSRYGNERLKKMFLLRSLKEAGVHMAFGSDGPLNPFLGILFAVTNPTNPPEAVSMEDAVHAYTYESAYVEFAEKEKGMLAPGMLADPAVLSQDIFAIPPDKLPATRSVLTIVAGKIEYEAP